MSRNLSWQEAVPRVIADFLVVHSSMIVALAISVVYQLKRGSGEEAMQLVADFEQYYIRFFWVLSPLFPLTFAVFGFYTHTRSYSDRRKNRAIATGVLVGASLFFGVNLLVGNTAVSRSVAVPFALLASF